MSKAVMHSVSPQQCERIAAGEQSILLSKTRPKLGTPFKDYIYCTKQKYHHLYDLRNVSNGTLSLSVVEHNKTSLVADGFLNGRVIGEFVCDRIDTYYYGNMDYPTPAYDGDKSVCEVGDGYWIAFDELCATCLDYAELEKYGNGATLYGWHISDLVIYDKPRELGEFIASTPKSKFRAHGDKLTRPFQSWGYVCLNE